MLLVQAFKNFLLSVQFTLLLMLTSLVSVFFILLNTSPVALGPAGMLQAFIIFYLWFFSLLLGALHIVNSFNNRSKDSSDSKSRLDSRTITLAAAWAFAPLIMLALQSIGQLEPVSLGLVVLFEVLASVYILKH